jgi:arylformamidase
MKVYDISMMINEGMQVYKNKPEKKPKIATVQDFSNATCHESMVSMNVHTGTHLDANLHMFENGSTIESIPLDRLVGPARVFDVSHVQEAITKADLEPFNIQHDEWIILKTRNSFSEDFDFDFVYVRQDAAEYLAEIGIRGVAIDGLGIERAQPEYPTHRSLMRKDIYIVEGLRLKEIEPGEYFMVIAPLKMEGIDAAPARALLIGDWK